MANDFLSQEFHENNDEIFKPISQTKRKKISFPTALVKALVATTAAVTSAVVLWGNLHIN